MTEAQARRVFETQLNSGSLASLPVGGILSAVLQASQGLLSVLPQGSVATPGYAGMPVTQGINTANFLKTPGNPQAVGNLNSNEIQGLLSQLSRSLGQSSATVSPTQGVGQYGVTPQQLEQNGYIKPGTVNAYLKNPSATASVLSASTVWTGKHGINNLSGLLGSPARQTTVQQSVINTNYQSLMNTGTINNATTPAQLAPLMQVAQKFGTTVASAWSRGAAPGDIVNQANALARDGAFALNFVDNKLPVTAQGASVIPGYNNQVNRQSVDQAVKAILGNDKIPVPDYATPGYSG